MEKVWLIKNRNAFILCKDEKDMIRRLSPTSDTQEVFEYQLKSSMKSSDFLKSRDRDSQLKSILGELDNKEQAIIDFISMFELRAPDGIKNKIYGYTTIKYVTDKDKILGEMKKLQCNKELFSALLIRNKHKLFNMITDVDWITAILKCHNFTSCVDSIRSWDSNLKKYKLTDNTTDELKNNFKLAKDSLKKPKVRKKKDLV